MKTYTKSEIRSKITTERAWTEKALVTLYHRQTSDEKIASLTRHDNDRGFNKPDSRRMTTYAKRIIFGRGHLTELELAWTQRRIGKYAVQLWKINRGEVRENVRRERRQYVEEASSLEMRAGEWLATLDYKGKLFKKQATHVNADYELVYVLYRAEDGDTLKVFND